MLTPFSVYLYPVLLLIGSNVFMTFAWYGHLKYKSVSLVTVIFVSWASPSLNTVFRCRVTALAVLFIRPRN